MMSLLLSEHQLPVLCVSLSLKFHVACKYRNEGLAIYIRSDLVAFELINGITPTRAKGSGSGKTMYLLGVSTSILPVILLADMTAQDFSSYLTRTTGMMGGLFLSWAQLSSIM